MENFIATGNSAAASGGGGSILGDAPSRSLGANVGSSSTVAVGNGGSDSDNWNGGTAAATTNGKRGGEAGSEELEEKSEGWSPENENEVFDCGEFQVSISSKRRQVVVPSSTFLSRPKYDCLLLFNFCKLE